MRFLRRPDNDNPNLLVGIFLLLLLSLFMSPNVLPRIASSVSPVIDEAAPCAWLRTADNLAHHQSLIGRATTNALALDVRPGSVPLSDSGVLSIDIVVINRSLGTVPIVYDPNQVNIGDNNTSGLGLIFTPENIQLRNTGRGNQTSYQEENIRLLGPRQRCVHTVDFRFNELDPIVRAGNAQVRAFYRINTAGAIINANVGPTPIYNDQGLDVVANGFVQSAAVPLTASGFTQ